MYNGQNYCTEFEKRIHSQQMLMQAPFSRKLIVLIQERVLSLFSLEKTRIIQKFSENYGLIHSFHKEYKIDKLTWKYNIALYQSNKNGKFFLRVEYEFISEGISEYNTMNYAFSDRSQYDGLYKNIHQLNGVEDPMDREYLMKHIIMELGNFSHPTTLQEQVDNSI